MHGKSMVTFVKVIGTIGLLNWFVGHNVVRNNKNIFRIAKASRFKRGVGGQIVLFGFYRRYPG